MERNETTLKGLGIKTHAKELLMTQELLTQLEEHLGPVGECKELHGYTVRVEDKLPPTVALFGGLPITIRTEPGKIHMEPAVLTLGDAE